MRVPVNSAGRYFAMSDSMYRKKDFMILLNIFDVKETMSHLLLRESFDEYLLEEVSVTTVAALKIQGRRNAAWYDEKEEAQALPDHLYWKEVKGFIFSYIKGKKTPTSFTVTLKLTAEEMAGIMPQADLAQLLQKQSTQVMLQFRFEKGKLSVVTGTVSSVFTMDKSVSIAWDNVVKDIFKGFHIGYEESV